MNHEKISQLFHKLHKLKEEESKTHEIVTHLLEEETHYGLIGGMELRIENPEHNESFIYSNSVKSYFHLTNNQAMKLGSLLVSFARENRERTEKEIKSLGVKY